MSNTTPRRECRTRQEQALAWTGAHALELTATGLPLIGGVLWTPWIDLASLVIAGLWARHEVLVHRRTAAARTARAAVLGSIPAARLTTTTAVAGKAVLENDDRDEQSSDETGPATVAGPEPAGDGAARTRRGVSR
ncbi:conjugal transfer protein TraH [Amycolatopsis sp. CA-128772]|uniref:conjugal transfer protein TraH n=1 Tax=Amycolatopsis sp. CA-128772 TaxID=2073159 RepID=UPI0018ED960C|nr:conjugal transfer protein TraH [Amycolatopsis sp. CA-128772]